MNQLRMEKIDLSDIPEANIQKEYELRVIKPDEKNKWEELILNTFKETNSYQDRIENVRGYVADGVFVIAHDDKLIATGTALCVYNDGQPEESACVHMIAADFEYSGQKLGYEITAAVLKKHGSPPTILDCPL